MSSKAVQDQETAPTDEQLLADPSMGTVEQVVEVLARSTPDQIEAVKDLEHDGKARVGVLDWSPPAPPAAAAAPASDDAVFSRERLLGPDGDLITGHPSGVIAGALAGNDSDQFTATQVGNMIDEFLTHEDTTGQEA